MLLSIGSHRLFGRHHHRRRSGVIHCRGLGLGQEDTDELQALANQHGPPAAADISLGQEDAILGEHVEEHTEDSTLRLMQLLCGPTMALRGATFSTKRGGRAGWTRHVMRCQRGADENTQ